MRHLKSFFSKEPQVGDYVLCEIDDEGYYHPKADLRNDFIKNNIGKIISIEEKKTDIIYLISFDVPAELKDGWFFHKDDNYHYPFSRGSIKKWSKKKDDLIPFLQGNKFGL